MPKAFSHLAAALACSLVAHLSSSSTSVVVGTRVYAAQAQLPRAKRGGIMPDVPPVVHANVLGFLGGRTGEGASKMNMLSRAAKEAVDEMHHTGQPEAHPETLRVGKLLRILLDAENDEDGDRAADNAIRDLDLNSLLASATPGVAEVARVCKLLHEMRHEPDQQALDNAMRECRALRESATPEVAKIASILYCLAGILQGFGNTIFRK